MKPRVWMDARWPQWDTADSFVEGDEPDTVHAWVPLYELKTREEVARFVEHQFDDYGSYGCKLNKARRHHYGKQEVRELMDFIYGGEPLSAEQQINGKKPRNGSRP